MTCTSRLTLLSEFLCKDLRTFTGNARRWLLTQPPGPRRAGVWPCSWALLQFGGLSSGQAAATQRQCRYTCLSDIIRRAH